jgi:predicted dehydrogenase
MVVADSALVVGGGSIGRRHIQNLQQLGVDVAVVDQSPEARSELSTNLNVTTFAELSDGLDSANPDVVVVCTPTRFHVDIATEAARAGCHLLIEKPLSDEMESVAELEGLVSEQDLISLVGCNLRFQPEIKKIHELLQKDVIGSIVAARIEGGSYLPEWFPDGDYKESYSASEGLGGGVILDYIHELNYARWFFGEFETVSAMAGQQSHLEIETNDVAGIIGKTRKGIICEFHLDYVQREYSRSCHIVGEEGTIRWSWSDEQVEWYVADEDTWHSFDRPGDWVMNDMYVDEMEHFLSSLQTGDEAICPISCGWNDLAVGLAARKSATTGRHVSPATLRE